MVTFLNIIIFIIIVVVFVTLIILISVLFVLFTKNAEKHYNVHFVVLLKSMKFDLTYCVIEQLCKTLNCHR